ncbi:MAG: PilX N-terminal domain-containing pilus assembly protein [Wenzhouxiangellaceae bacterium]|nr:PilX N-terminal domain-containing pilus assembly protein [Wenzhouxiangellaceae bacterium]
MHSLIKATGRQQGTALVFSILILLIMTIVGVAALSNTQMQERMAGNVNVQSLAFEAASAGVAEALAYGMTRWDARGCNRAEGGWSDDGYADTQTLALEAGAAQQLTIGYQLKADCLEDPGFADASDPGFQPPVQMYVTSLGLVSAANGGELATREIEVRIDNFRSDGLSALRVEGDATVLFDPANSQKFIVDGNGGAAVSTSSLANANSIVQGIDDVDRLGNYRGGVGRSDYKSPFNSASQMARFALEIRAFMNAPTALACNPVTVPLTDFVDEFGSPYTATLNFIDGDFSIGGATDFSGLTYVTGDLSMSGSPTGSGLVIVEGDIQWSGKAQFAGLVLGLGGTFTITGGGDGETRGMVYVADIPLSSLTEGGLFEIGIEAILGDPWLDVLKAFDTWGDPQNVDTFAGGALIGPDHPDGFGETIVDLTGGGRHTITYNCSLIDGWRQVLAECGIQTHERSYPDTTKVLDNIGLAEPWADLGCNIPGQGGTIQAIRSWRENLGWRELLESSS